MVRFGEIWEIFKVLAREGGLGVIHAEDDDIVHAHVREAASPRTAPASSTWPRCTTRCRRTLFRRIIRLAENVEGMALYMMHVSAAAGVRGDRREPRARLPDLRRDAAPVPALHAARTTSSRTARSTTPIPRSNPSATSKALWDGLAHGSLHCVATDEVCCNLSVKVQRQAASTTPPAATPASSRASR